MNFFAYIDSPIGRLRVHGDDRDVTALFLDGSRRVRSVAGGGGALEDPSAGALPAALRQLEEYFRGSRRTFTVPLKPRGTPFQERVWRALLQIPYGATCSYGQLARRLHNPGAARAVGLANNRNPIPILVPCHRVIGADGSLIGYGGGLERKRWLLALEGAIAPGSDRVAPVPRR